MRKTALVTGAGRGIGFAIAEKLAAEGHDIVLMDIHEESVVAEAIQRLESAAATVLYQRADVSSAEDRADMLAAVKARFGRLDVLVNNAGVAPRVRADILEASEDSYEWVMKINLQGPYFLTQAVANWMIEQKQANADFDGCIINIASMSSGVASPSRGEYCVSKAGMSMMTQLFAVRLGEFEIPVYEIRPGIIKTDMTAVVTEKYDRLIFEEGILVQSRWGLPEDIAKAAAMMVRGDIGYSTGQIITIDGGFTLPRL
ncbi:MAG: 3-ketoacyl-ACP reductase [Kiritimatiellia bacterium]|jgi:NAD(P)-dependent dehydrogenase (short-subunit alcohol dehydrogenase family)|nr:3-ketoacyl-ACP reductase [Kiritimatiellia bacterium]MDP6630974.1 3-ketoacyl-ACP reductase [Kiritimatiellia bacterium]MDP6810277.1 3-ketoacyl-ACP reductase [Kiritimatiellia bacterium]MDP7022734.1 3-ketoacyl-ACP reductase [Kiritimatiellia bacterium]